MLTKGEIISIDYTGNTCKVHVPFFDGAVGGEPFIQNAIIINPPGIFNGYKVGDTVEVSFEDNEYSKLVVLGKLYLGIEREMAEEARGVVNCQILDTAQSAKLPVDTSLTINKTNKDIILENSGATYKTVSDIIDRTIENTDEIKYRDTAPTEDNNSGNLKVVVLSYEPSTYYNGYIYYITEE